MKLELQRRTADDGATFGSLYIDGQWTCFTLEDEVRIIGINGSGKIPGQTAIPEGTYQVVVDQSQRFKRLLPRLKDVPYFEGIRIHAGNTTADTEGCILVGLDMVGTHVLARSLLALQVVMDKLTEGLQTGPVTITIKHAETTL